MINHIKRWWYWQKNNRNSFFHKILVLLGIRKSPTFYQVWTPKEAEEFYKGFIEGLKEGK